VPPEAIFAGGPTVSPRHLSGKDAEILLLAQIIGVQSCRREINPAWLLCRPWGCNKNLDEIHRVRIGVKDGKIVNPV